MRWEQLTAAVTAPNKRALLSLVRVMKGHMRLLCLAGLAESGILQRLTKPTSAAELADDLKLVRVDLLESLLELGASLGELKRRGDEYRCRGALATTMATPEGAPIAAFLSEQVRYHNPVFRDLAPRMRGEPNGDYLPAVAPLISIGSRMVEPFLRPFAKRMTENLSAPRILEIGCGEGAYVAWYAADCPGCSGVALELDARVAEKAANNLEAWGVEGFEVVHGDILEPPDALGGRFELITSIQNIYYFSAADRRRLFNWVRRSLSDGGAFALVTAAGFEDIDEQRLIPGDEFIGFLAR